MEKNLQTLLVLFHTDCSDQKTQFKYFKDECLWKKTPIPIQYIFHIDQKDRWWDQLLLYKFLADLSQTCWAIYVYFR